MYRFRIRVVTRLLAEAVQRSDLETYLQDETKNDKDNHRWDDKKKIKDEIEEVKRKGGKTGKQSIMGHVYWPNLYIALPCLVERYPLMRVARLNEEKHEQSFLVNKKFVTNARGQQNFQVMHKYAFNRRLAEKKPTVFVRQACLQVFELSRYCCATNAPAERGLDGKPLYRLRLARR